MKDFPPIPERASPRIVSSPEGTDRLLPSPVPKTSRALVSKRGCSVESPGAFVKIQVLFRWV